MRQHNTRVERAGHNSAPLKFALMAVATAMNCFFPPKLYTIIPQLTLGVKTAFCGHRAAIIRFHLAPLDSKKLYVRMSIRRKKGARLHSGPSPTSEVGGMVGDCSQSALAHSSISLPSRVRISLPPALQSTTRISRKNSVNSHFDCRLRKAEPHGNPSPFKAVHKT